MVVLIWQKPVGMGWLGDSTWRWTGHWLVGRQVVGGFGPEYGACGVALFGGKAAVLDLGLVDGVGRMLTRIYLNL